MEEIDVAGYAAIRDSGEEHLLIDVREPSEWATCHLEGARHIPLRSLPGRLEELAGWEEKAIYVMCHHGGRSAQATMFLMNNGFERVSNVAGGIHQWALQVDPDMPTY